MGATFRKLRPTLGTDTEQSFTLIRDVERFASNPGATEAVHTVGRKNCCCCLVLGCNRYAYLECQKCSTPKRPSQALFPAVRPHRRVVGIPRQKNKQCGWKGKKKRRRNWHRASETAPRTVPLCIRKSAAPPADISFSGLHQGKGPVLPVVGLACM